MGAELHNAYNTIVARQKVFRQFAEIIYGPLVHSAIYWIEDHHLVCVIGSNDLIHVLMQG